MDSHAAHINHSEHGKHNWLGWAGAGISAVVAAPYIGKAFGAGNDFMAIMHSHHAGAGLALWLNDFIKDIPVVGETLAAGGWEAAASAGVIGIGGMLIGNYIQKNYDKEDAVPWGKIIKYACLATSILISLPSILSGLTVGFTYIAGLIGSEVFANEAGNFFANTLGMTAMNHMSAAGAAGGIGSLLTHFVTCGGSALSMTGAMFLDRSADGRQHNINIAYTDHNEQPAARKIADDASVEIVSSSPIVRGQECRLALRLRDGAGQVLGADNLLTTHTQKLHLMLTDRSLTDYYHIHPKYDAESGMFLASFIPNMQSEYSAWSDFTLGSGKNIIFKNSLPAERDFGAAPSIQHTNNGYSAGVNIELKANPPLSAGCESHLQVHARDEYGKPVQLEPIMGAYAHLVGFSKDGQEFIHCHPVGSTENGDLDFHVSPMRAGFSKFFLQVKTEGREVTIPFGQYIKPPEKFSERNYMMPHIHEHGAGASIA